MTEQLSPGEAMGRTYRMAFGFITSQILGSAVHLGIPDALAAGPATADQLAQSTRTTGSTLGRLLRALVVLGILVEGDSDRYSLTLPGRLLCSDHPASMRSSLRLSSHPAVWRAWGALADSVRSGTPAFEYVHGQPLFPYLTQDPELSEIFHTAMRSGTQQVGPQLTAAYDVSSATTVVDVGGGNGALLAAVLQAAPNAQGILYDTAEGLINAPELLRRSGVADRCRTEVGDFFQNVPAGDLVLLKGILHDWDDERCLVLLDQCRRSIATGGRLLVLEPVIPDDLQDPRASSAVMSDIAMLVYTGGQERTQAEFHDLLAAGGFTLLETTTPLSGTDVRVLVAAPS